MMDSVDTMSTVKRFMSLYINIILKSNVLIVIVHNLLYYLVKVSNKDEIGCQCLLCGVE